MVGQQPRCGFERDFGVYRPTLDQTMFAGKPHASTALMPDGLVGFQLISNYVNGVYVCSYIHIIRA